MTAAADRAPGPATDPVQAVRAVLEDLGPVDTARDPQAPAGLVDPAGPTHRGGVPGPADGDGPDHPTDRLERVDEAHRRLRRLLEVPDA